MKRKLAYHKQTIRIQLRKGYRGCQVIVISLEGAIEGEIKDGKCSAEQSGLQRNVNKLGDNCGRLTDPCLCPVKVVNHIGGDNDIVECRAPQPDLSLWSVNISHATIAYVQRSSGTFALALEGHAFISIDTRRGALGLTFGEEPDDVRLSSRVHSSA